MPDERSQIAVLRNQIRALELELERERRRNGSGGRRLPDEATVEVLRGVLLTCLAMLIIAAIVQSSFVAGAVMALLALGLWRTLRPRSEQTDDWPPNKLPSPPKNEEWSPPPKREWPPVNESELFPEEELPEWPSFLLTVPVPCSAAELAERFVAEQRLRGAKELVLPHDRSLGRGCHVAFDVRSETGVVLMRGHGRILCSVPAGNGFEIAIRDVVVTTGEVHFEEMVRLSYSAAA